MPTDRHAADPSSRVGAPEGPPAAIVWGTHLVMMPVASTRTYVVLGPEPPPPTIPAPDAPWPELCSPQCPMQSFLARGSGARRWWDGDGVERGPGGGAGSPSCNFVV